MKTGLIALQRYAPLKLITEQRQVGSKIGQIVLNVPPDLLQFSLVGPFLNFLECLAKIYLNWLIYITKKKILAKVTIQTMDQEWSLTGVISIV